MLVVNKGWPRKIIEFIGKLFSVASVAGATSGCQVPGPCRNQLREGWGEVGKEGVVALKKIIVRAKVNFSLLCLIWFKSRRAFLTEETEISHQFDECKIFVSYICVNT